VARLIVPSLDIDAPIVTLGVDATGTMEAPDTPTDVAWYDFSARPGEVGNVVLAGHLDFINYGPAVFYHLKDARPGDQIELVLVDGTIARYRVVNVTAYDDATAPVQEIVGPTDTEVVTLITCGGSFDEVSREYDKRVVLRANRIDSTAIAQ
jgi:LPXTG-site transpeptidase (sortase) family protein